MARPRLFFLVILPWVLEAQEAPKAHIAQLEKQLRALGVEPLQAVAQNDKDLLVGEKRRLDEEGEFEEASEEGEGGEAEAGEEEFMEVSDSEEAGGSESEGGEKGGEEGSEAGSEEEGSEEEEEEEEEEFSDVDVAVGMMLISAMAFVMFAYTLVHYPDKDIQFYIWSVISSSIGIFIAVLLFTSSNSLIHNYLLRGHPHQHQVLADFAFMATLFFTLQTFTYFQAGAGDDQPFKDPDDIEATPQVYDVNLGKHVPNYIWMQKDQRLRRLRSFAALLAHMTAFAAVDLGHLGQSGEFVKIHPTATFAVVLIYSVVLIHWSRNCRRFRTWLVKNRKLKQENKNDQVEGIKGILCPKNPEEEEEEEEESHWKDDQGRDTEFAKTMIDGQFTGQNFAVGIWVEEIYEAEVDLVSLAVSFLLVQAIRFNISGVLPNELGVEEEHYVHSGLCSVYLLGTAVGFILFLAVVCYLGRGILSGGIGVDNSCCSSRKLAKRVAMFLVCTGAMCFAWCLYYGSKWELARQLPQLGNPNGVVPRVILALFLTFVALGGILGVDRITDTMELGKAADLLLKSIIQAFCILIGFGWEQAIDGGVEAIADKAPFDPALAQFGLAVATIGVVMTPWRRHIVQKVLVLEKEHKEHVAEKKSELKRKASGRVVE